MVKVIAVRGANGVMTFHQQATTPHAVLWHCSRDAFTVPANPTLDALDSTLANLATHAVTHVGAVSQVVELEI